MLLHELFKSDDHTFPLTWQKEDHTVLVRFRSSNSNLELRFHDYMNDDFEYQEGAYEITFSDSGGTNFPTGTGDGFAVYATLVKAIKEFIANYNPNIILFNGFINKQQRLYKAMIGKLINDIRALGFSLSEEPSSTAERPYFKLTKRGINPDIEQDQ